MRSAHLSDYHSISCGVAYLTDLGQLVDEDHEARVKYLFYTISSREGSMYFHLLPGQQIIFSDRAGPASPGSKLADFLTKKQWGRIEVTSPCRNPNTGNRIKIWCWRINKKFIRDYNSRNET